MRLLKQIFGDLKDGNRLAHKPKLWFDDCLKDALTQKLIPVGDWEKRINIGHRIMFANRTFAQRIK